MKEDLLLNLNEQQKKAVVHIDGPLLIIAGPGSGKTKVLTHRIAYLMASGIKSENILAVTFTNKASDEMKERVENLLSKLNKNIKAPFIGTFHSICVRILRIEITALDYKSNFVIYDEDDSVSLIKQIIRQLKLNEDQFKYIVIKEIISKLKNELISVEDYKKTIENFYESKIAEIYSIYQENLKKNNIIDLDDIIMLVIELFKKYPAILNKYQEKFKYLLIDEFQDTNIAQYEFSRLLSAKYNNICVVGDTDQSIYGWRAADFRNVLKFEKDWPGATIVKLEENYRSTPEILNIANAIIEKNIFRTPKIIWTQNPSGLKPIVQQLKNEKEEAFFIFNEIENLLSQNYKLKDCVVLYRMNVQSRPIEEYCIKNNIPYRIIGSIKFYQRKEVKDIMAWLKFILNENDIVSLERIINITMGLGTTTFEKIVKNGLENTAKENQIFDNVLKLRSYFYDFLKINTLSRLLIELLKKINYKDYLDRQFGKQKTDFYNEAETRWENVKEILGIVKSYDGFKGIGALEKFIEDISLFSESDEINLNKEVVNLMTLHCVKGLEFPVVFLSGFEEGLLPHSRSLVSFEDLEEERRLCYVGITRAKQRLYFTFTKKRLLFGGISANSPSRFLNDIPEDLADIRFLDNDYLLNDIEEDDYEPFN